MAYAAVTCLYQTIDLLLDSSRISVDSSTQEILSSALNDVASLKMALHTFNGAKNSSDGVMAVDARIRDEARRLEDAIESEASSQFHSQSQMQGSFSLNLHHLRHEIDCFVETAKKMREEYTEELDTWPPPPPPAAAASSSTNVDMVGIGISDLFLKIRDRVLTRIRSVDFNIVTITGMAGTGKTELVKKILNDPSIKEEFECRAFVRVGQVFDFDELLRSILAQINIVDIEEDMLEGESIHAYFRRILGRRKYLFVFDDVWDKHFRPFITQLLTVNGYVLVTSRLDEAFYFEGSRNYYHHRMQLLKDEESWELLQRKVFSEEYDCPSLLVKAGKKIAESCEGLPLLIGTIARLLREAPKTPEYWKEVAEMKNSVFEDAMAQLYEVLLPSYHYLDQNDKACFLYLLAFPKSCAVGRSRINNLWHAEKFATGIENIIGDLVANNVVVIREKRIRLTLQAKTCSLHVVYRHLCKTIGENNKFLRILNRYEDEGVKEERLLAVYHNTLLAIKEVYTSIASFSTVRSVLCTGPYHRYQVPIICLELKLLKVLDALSIRFYEFPVEVVKLIQLRYLSLTTNANLPPSMSKLWFLECLIVHQHLSIINRSVASYVPVEIWELQELEHLQIIGRNLPHPPPGTTLPKLKELVGVGIQSVAKDILESLPYLQKLRIQIESAPDLDPHASQTITCFDHISCLERLTSLRSAVVNPVLMPKPTLPPRLPSNVSTSHLVDLSLSGFGYPWEDMSKIAELSYLKMLKLRCYAFRGEQWEASKLRFKKLRYLLIEDADLVKWSAADETFKRLRYLSMRNCHKLHEIPLFDDSIKIELFDCNPLAETCAMQDQFVNYSWKNDDKLVS